MAELQLPLPFEAKRLHRRTDPVTSMLSAEGARTLTAAHHREIMFVLNDGFPRAAEEISEIIEWRSPITIDSVAVNRRLIELERAKLIERTDQRHTNRSGRQAFKWRAV